MSITTIDLDAEVERQLEVVASRLQRSKSWVVNKALSEYIEKQERWRQTVEAMESASQGRVVDANQVHRWLYSWGTQCKENTPKSGY